MVWWGSPWGSLWGLGATYDVAAIHALADNEGGWVLFIEGCRTAFTNVPDLVGSGASSWIGTAYGDREVLLGLVMPSELPLGETDPWRGRIEQPRAVEFGLIDYDGSVAELFKALEPDATTDAMGRRLAPSDDPAPEQTVGDDQTPVDLWGRHLGLEAIGPAGQRRWFWCTPSGAPPGFDHFAGAGWPAIRITDSPTVWTGRKVTVYRIVKDPETGAWPDWQDQHDGGSLRWYGALKDIGRWQNGQNGRQLSIACFGPAAWLRKSAGLSRPTTWHKPSASVSVSGDDLKVAAWIGQLAPVQVEDGVTVVPSTFDCQTLASGNTFAGCTTKEEIVTRLQDIVYTMFTGDSTGTILDTSNSQYVGPGPVSNGVWKDGDSDRDIVISNDGGHIKIKCEADSGSFDGFYVGIAINDSLWQMLGWDINDTSIFSTSAGLCPVGGYLWGDADETQQMPDNHYVGIFSTRPSADVGEAFWENGGHYNDFIAHYPEGTVTVRPDGGDDLRIAIGPIECEGQFGQPFTYGSQIDGVDCDAAGWWVFRGKFLSAKAYEEGETEAIDFTQVALCEWVATSDGSGVEVDGGGFARIRTVRWEDPRAFGLPFDRLTEPWVNVAGGLECAPIAVLGGTGLHVGVPDYRHRLIPRTLLSSGTAAWDDSTDPVSITPGANHPGDAPNGDPYMGDLEVADLGLGLPPAFVDWQSWYTACDTIPGGRSGALNRVMYPIFGSHRLEGDGGVLVEAMRGAGLAWSVKRQDGGVVPAFGAYDPLRKLSLADVEVTLSREDMAEMSSPLTSTDPMWRGDVDFRNGGPYDRFPVSVDRDPLEGGYALTRTYESRDEGRRFRDGRIEWKVEDGGLRNPTHWLDKPDLYEFYGWEPLAMERFGAGFGPRHARPLRIYRNTYNQRFAGLIGLGTVARIIDPTAEAPDGSRGIDHIGHVVECSIVARGAGNECVRVAVELEAASDSVKVFAPIAFAGVGSWNGDTNTLTVIEDWAGVGGGHSDVLGFTQPEWDTSGAGSMKARIYQSEDGITLLGSPVTANVVSVDAEAHTLSLSDVDGTIYRDTIKVIVGASYDEQDAEWVLGLFSPVTLSTGYYNGAKGYRL